MVAAHRLRRHLEPVSKRRQWVTVGMVLLVAAIAAATWFDAVGDDLDCTADRQAAIETGQTPPDCE